MAFINQGSDDAYVSIHIKHPISGVKIIDMIELADYLTKGYVKLESPTVMYHAISGHDIFDESELVELEKDGWVDSPAKLILDVVPSGINSKLDLSSENEEEVDQAAQELLAGEGLNQAALMRALDFDPSKTTQRNQFKPVYLAVFAKYLPKIKKQGYDYFWKSKTVISDGIPPEDLDETISDTNTTEE